MTLRLLILAAMLAPAAFGQLQLLLVDSNLERAVPGLLDIGSIAAGDTIDTRFRVRNTGAAPASVQRVSVAGVAFSLPNPPFLPYQVASGAAMDFAVRFAPLASGAHSATLTVNSTTIILRAAATAAPALAVEQNGAWQGLVSGALVDFGPIERGAAAARRFTLTNATGEGLRISTLAVSGVGFRGPLGLAAPVALEPDARASFEVVFEPAAAGDFEGALVVDRRTVRLRGTATEIPQPRPVVQIESAAASAQQGKLRVAFDAPARASGAGQVEIKFQSGVEPAPDDPTVGFLPALSRFARFTVEKGDLAARFGDRQEVVFQTGTTAGTLSFTASLGGRAEAPVTLAIPAALIGVDDAQAVRSGSSLEVQIRGFDNSRTARQLSFTFYDQSGGAVAPGAITAEVADAFKSYFKNSDLGGAFMLRAVFPVTGNAAGVAAVEVDLVNGAGAAHTGRLRF